MKRRITPKDQYTTYANYPLVAGDVRAYEICLDLGSDVTGAEFKVTAFRADGQVVEDIGTVENGTALYTMASNMYSVPGELTVRLAVLHNMSVLTDREIVFEVLSGGADAVSGENVVPLNDSVILRVGNIEQRLSDKVDKEEGKSLSSNDFTDEYKAKLDDLCDSLDGHKEDSNNPHIVTAEQVGAYTKDETDLMFSDKVDKEEGKGLSANDFTDEYKEKLDGFDEVVGKVVERVSESVDNLWDSLDGHMEDTNNPHNVSADQIGVYTKDEVDKMMVGGCKVMGEVDTFDDLPYIYTFKAVGAPYIMKGGAKQEVGTYNSETGEVTFDAYQPDMLIFPLMIPVESKTIKEGYYAFGGIDVGNITINCSGNISCWIGDYNGDDEPIECGKNISMHYSEALVSVLTIYFKSTISGDLSIDGTSEITGYIHKVNTDKEGAQCEPLAAGHMYKVSEENVRYIWLGEDWEVFGGASDEVDLFETTLGDIEAALDTILEIQNSLIGGEAK